MALVFFRILSRTRDTSSECSFWIFHTSVPFEEADPLFLEALGDAGGSIIHGEDDRDGRGIQVQSCTFTSLKWHCFYFGDNSVAIVSSKIWGS